MMRQRTFRSEIEPATDGAARESWVRYVNSLFWERGQLDLSSWNAFLRAGSLGISQEEALEVVAGLIKAADDHPKLSKLKNQIRRAFAQVKPSEAIGNRWSPKACIPRPMFCPEYARKISDHLPEADMRWLKKRSPTSVSWMSPAEYLACVFPSGDRVLIFTDFKSQGQAVWEHGSLKIDRDELNRFVKGHADGVWFLSNPVDGHHHFNRRQDRMSRRSEESITAFRHAVLESDCQPLDQWLRILVQLPVPIVSITSSGGKSLHALFQIDAHSKIEWDKAVGAMKPRLIQLGADANALTAVRLTRLANCYRGDRLQELIYLDPRPSGEPIWATEG